VTATAHAAGWPEAAHAGAVRSAPARTGTRFVWDAGRFVDADVYARDRLGADAAFDGPAIVEQYDTTCWIPAGWRASAGAAGTLVLERRA
jgi:N-methylhydantoinase A